MYTGSSSTASLRSFDEVVVKHRVAPALPGLVGLCVTWSILCYPNPPCGSCINWDQSFLKHAPNYTVCACVCACMGVCSCVQHTCLCAFCNFQFIQGDGHTPNTRAMIAITCIYTCVQSSWCFAK